MSRGVALSISFALALVAVLGLRQAWQRQQMQQDVDKVRVVTVSRDLKVGRVLSPSDLNVQQRPGAYVDPGLVLGSDIKSLPGLQLCVARRAGEVLNWADLSKTSRTLADAVPPGERAFTLVVDESSGIGGHLRVNDRVDVIGLFDRSTGVEGELRRVAQTVLENATIMAVGEVTQTGAPANGYATVTLSVTPAEAQVLALCQEEAELRLSLRNPEDMAAVEDTSVILEDVLEKGALKTRGRARQERIRVYRGGEGR